MAFRIRLSHAPRLALAAAALSGMIAAGATPASAGEASAALARVHLEDGTLAAGDAAMVAALAADPTDEEARYGLGVIRFVRAIEHLSQNLYRYGLASSPQMTMAVVRLPVPDNPLPEPITYEAFRGILKDFADDLAKADEALAGMGTREAKLPLDVTRVRYDADANGVVGADERFSAVLSRMIAGEDFPDDPAIGFIVGFDRADAIWLRGYSHVVMALMEFWLAHDWHQTYDAVFHRFFPKGDFPLAAEFAPLPPQSFLDPGDLSDAVNFIHLFNWPVAEPARMLAVRDHLKQVFALSRANWDAIEAETDNDREWLPNPSQTAVIADAVVTADQIHAWRSMLDVADRVLDGELLVPHWRLARGFNLGRVFTEPRPFDLVLWITGPAALPYLEDGPVIPTAEWGAMQDVFGGNFPGYLFWFN